LFYLQQQCGRNKSLLKRMNNITIHPKRLLFYLQQQCGRNKSLLKRMNNITIHPLTISLEEHPNILQLTSLRSKITAVVSVAYSIMQRLPLEFL